jgi:LytR cell envelope-related transcriptional attenuator
MGGALGLASSFRNGGLLELARRGLIAACAALWACGGDGGERAYPIPGERDGRVIVEVLNAGGRPGAARTGALTLRRAGIDVVYFGNADTTFLDSTRILVRRGAVAAGNRVRAALKVGQVRTELDSSRLLDVTVLLGRDFTPPFDFHP